MTGIHVWRFLDGPTDSTRSPRIHPENKFVGYILGANTLKEGALTARKHISKKYPDNWSSDKKLATRISDNLCCLIGACEEDESVTCLEVFAEPFINLACEDQYPAQDDRALGVLWGLVRAASYLNADRGWNQAYREKLQIRLMEIMATQISSPNNTVSTSAANLGYTQERSETIRELCKSAHAFFETLSDEALAPSAKSSYLATKA